jgi:hypothetical protein
MLLKVLKNISHFEQFRFCSIHLTVHTVTATDLKKMDTFTDQYIKKWAGVPKCTTNSLIHMRAGY